MSFERVSSIAGAVTAVALDGDRLYVAERDRVAVVDVVDPTRMRVLGVSAELAGDIRALATSGTIVVAALGTSGVAVIDVSGPAPNTSASLLLPGSAEGVAVVGDLAYIADGPLGVVILDLSSPRAPRVVASVDGIAAYGVSVSSVRAFVASGGAGVTPLDLTDPRHPAVLKAIALDGYVLSTGVVGGVVVAAAAWAGAALIDASSAPPRTSLVKLSSWAMSVAPGPGDLAYVADADAGLRVLDVKTGATIAGFDTLGGHVAGVAVGRDTAFLADLYGGVRAISIHGTPREVGDLGSLAQADGLALLGDTAYVATSRGGVRALDLSDPAQPRDVASVATALPVSGVEATADGLLAITVPDGVFWVDTSQPGVPNTTASRSMTATVTSAPFGDDKAQLGRAIAGPVRSGVVRGSTAFWANEWGMLVVDERHGDLCAMSFVQAAPDPLGAGTTVAVDVSASTAYIGQTPAQAQNGGLIAMDMSDPGAPKVIGTLSRAQAGGEGFLGVLAAAGHVYAIGASRFSVIDVADPSSMHLIGQSPLPSDPYVGVTLFQPLDTLGGLVVAADGAALVAYDVSDPKRPRVAGQVALAGSIASVVVRDDLLLVGTSTGLELLRVRIAPTADDGVSSRALAAPFRSLCTVTTEAADGPGSLTQCARTVGPGGVVDFDPTVFAPAAPRTIYLDGGLAISIDGVAIDGTGAGVILDGSRGAHPFAGVNVKANNAVIRGLTLQNFDHGIFIEGNGNTVGASDAAGHVAIRGSAEADIVIHGGTRNIVESATIGDAPPGRPVVDSVVIDDGASHNIVRDNTIAGSIQVGDVGSSYNEIVGNTIGTPGRTATGGNPIVVAVFESFNRIGGAGPHEGNVITAMVSVSASDVFVLGNTIMVPGRGPGLDLGAARHATIGGLSPGEGNHIEGTAQQAALRLHGGPVANVIAGNALHAAQALLVDDGAANLFAANDLGGGAVTLRQGAHANRLFGTIRGQVDDEGTENAIR